MESYFEKIEAYYDQVSETYLSNNADNLKNKEMFKRIYEESYKSKDYLNRYKRCQKLNLILTYNSLVAENDLDYKFFLTVNNNLNIDMKALKTNLLFSKNKTLLNKAGKTELPDDLLKIELVTRKDCDYCINLKNNLNLVNLNYNVYSFDNLEDLEHIRNIEREFGKIVLVPFVIVDDDNIKYGQEKDFKENITKKIQDKLYEIEKGDMDERTKK
ncbi:hypothetical protein [Peptoniphilus timonensis]|uniref:hypothetical protein n=1 Tax=Peptoniphilus timonensis TaxID=1268254 RepID=UPI0012DC6C4C|nr:hypothetical protein [Peptoniphilus timonensis]